ncbi:penicillin-binding protein activator [Candidatus Thiosymbion oneisti]|uniref:penicillin-binding protein activator n=1 Tax=Candidatus Thiosymbion oneisti TaxID=589554 RepID=UPI0013FD5A36|nr:penicillin-binding protein activator [Candidatus Thiosymbion oneisti]
MFQKIDPTATARIAILSLLATLVIALSGCAGLRTKADSERDRLVTGGYQGNETLAVLLPESGRFAGAANVVRAGILAAREADPEGKRPKLRFYDSAAGSISALVRQAAKDGARLAIGPLQKPAVEKLAGSTTLPIPVLALNRVAAAAKPSNLYQFSLAPEDEVSEIAARAWGEGHRKAVILYPKSKWGERMSRAFRRQWKAQGGTLVTAQAFNPRATDFSSTVKKLSEQVAQADFMFLATPSKLARRAWVQIRSKLGTKTRVYATSHIYDGHFDPKDDKYLVGLNFVEIPWLVEPTPGDAVSSKGLSKQLPRLYAMGIDAYRLGSRLDWLSGNPQVRVQGKTGTLRLDSRRRVQRKLTLARMDATGPVKLEPTSDQQKPELRIFAWAKSLF